MKKYIASALLLIALLASQAPATPISFTGSYSQNFTVLDNSTAMPAGYTAMGIAVASDTFLKTSPITAANIASSYASNTQTLIIANPNSSGSANFRAKDTLYNFGSLNGATVDTSDRALGTGPTTTGATVIQLALTNQTGSPITQISFAYDMKVLSYGTPKSSGFPNNESSELPGYSFFYSTTGGTTAADWIAVPALSLNGYSVGTTYNAGTILNLSTALAAGSTFYARWADDNSDPISPDQNFAIDNVVINSVPEPATMTLLGLGLSSLVLRRNKK